MKWSKKKFSHDDGLDNFQIIIIFSELVYVYR